MDHCSISALDAASSFLTHHFPFQRPIKETQVSADLVETSTQNFGLEVPG